jgi:hypothetical protein
LNSISMFTNKNQLSIQFNSIQLDDVTAHRK